MKYFKGMWDYKSPEETAITLGKFDGLHRGHQKLIQQVRKLKSEKGVQSVIFAFDMNPLFEKIGVLREGIMTNEERRLHLDGYVDVLIECPFTDEISIIDAEGFIEKILVGKFHAKYIVVGTDFCFGYKKRGNVEMLAKYAEHYGYELFVIEKEMYHDREISSTFTREELKNGNLKVVNELLGYPYEVYGTVEHGRKLGRTLGFPTMNVQTTKDKMLPPNGVYFCNVRMDGKNYNSIVNVGIKPTVTSDNVKLIECNLLDYSGNAYGKDVLIQFFEFKRPEQKFDTLEALKYQVEQDIYDAKIYFNLDTK